MNYRSYSASDKSLNDNFSILNELDLYPKSVYPLNNTLDNNELINYKFNDDYLTYPKNYRKNRSIID